MLIPLALLPFSGTFLTTPLPLYRFIPAESETSNGIFTLTLVFFLLINLKASGKK